jgi:hypothetical protein
MIALIELAHLLRPVGMFRRLLLSAERARRVTLRPGADRWKERAIKGSSKQLFLRSVQVGGLIVLISSPLWALLLADRRLGLGVQEALFNWYARLCLMMLCLAYATTRYFLARALRLR